MLAATGHWYLYFALWLLPFLTWQQAITRVRNIAEHAMVPDDNDDFRNARTTKANWLARMTLAPYWVNYHVEHHLMMWIPCYNLPKGARVSDRQRVWAAHGDERGFRRSDRDGDVEAR